MPGFQPFLVIMPTDSALRDELLAAPDPPVVIVRAQELALVNAIR
jgi:hypothetical protein